MERTARSKKNKMIFVSVVVVSFLYYIAPLNRYLLQELITRLYYVPIVLGAVWFGLRGGARVSLLVTLICVPHTFMSFKYDRALFYDEILEILLFNVVGIAVGILKDRERGQSALNQKLIALATLGEAVSSVAHEIKNMLIPIRGFLRRIRENQNPETKVISYLEIVEQETANLEKMVKDMLSFGRNAPLQKTEVEVGPLVEEMRKILQEEFRDNGIRFVCQCQEGINSFKLDREKIRHALSNLIQNAIQASSKDKEVRLFIRHDQGILQIIIEDDGEGIDQKHMDQLFQPFFSTKAQGTGLGLLITKQIVEQHGGKIRIESEPGNGTRVFLNIPGS